MELKTLNVPDSVKIALKSPMPDYIVKEKPGTSKASYVTGQAVIDKLNATFGYCGWSWEIVDKWIEKSVDKVIKTRYEGGQKKTLDPPLYEPQLPVAHVVGKLTVYFEMPDGTFHTVCKMAPGSQPVTGGQSEQENCFKGAHTDALKKASTMFGIGLELYRDNNEQYFFEDLFYENPWTDIEIENHKPDFELIKNFKEIYHLDNDGLNQYINQYSSGTMPTAEYLLPSNITDFVDYLKGIILNNAQGA